VFDELALIARPLDLIALDAEMLRRAAYSTGADVAVAETLTVQPISPATALALPATGGFARRRGRR
jgi:hypothetical protein